MSDINKELWNRKNPFIAKILKNKLLSGSSSKKEIRHYEIDLVQSGLAYEVGDTIGIFPLNNSELVEQIIHRLKVKPSFIPLGYEDNIFTILQQKTEILTPTKRLIEYIEENIGSKNLTRLLKNENKEGFNNFKWGMDVLDFMNLNADFQFKTDIFLSLLKSLQHRAYSISSSLNVYKNQAHITVASVRWKSDARTYNGVCSTFLADDCISGSEVGIFLIPNKLFRLPDNSDDNIIMVGPGTGLAPFRAFLQERKFQNAKGKNWLFFGDQTRNNDFIYENEISNLKQSGFLNKLDLAFSRDQEEKNYVQHKMYSSRKELFHWIDQGAYFYVCGDATHMAKDVDNMLHQVIQEGLKTSYEKAKEYIKNLKTQKRYLRDVY